MNTKHILKLLISFLIFLIGGINLIQKVKADNFYSSGGDINNCNLAVTTSTSWSDLPGLSTENGIWYEPGNVKGEREGFIENTRFAPDLGTLAYPNAHRNTKAMEVAVPPNTTVDIGAYTHNYSGHTIDINAGWLYLSRPDAQNGDLTRLEASGNSQSTSWKEGNNIKTRTGKAVFINSLGQKANNTNPNQSIDAGKKIYSFKTIQPIQIIDYQVFPRFMENGLHLDFKVKIKNHSEYVLSQIYIKHNLAFGNFEETHTFQPQEEKEVNYSRYVGKEYGEVVTIPPLEITDPNSHTESVAIGGENTLIVSRNDSNATNWYANQPDYPNKLQVTLIPYKVFGEAKHMSFVEGLQLEKKVKDKNGIYVDSNVVQGDLSTTERQIEYKLSVTNTGQRFWNDILVEDDYTEELFIPSEYPEGILAGGKISWKIAELAPGYTKEFYVKGSYIEGIPDNSFIHNYAKAISGNKIVYDNISTEVKSPKLQMEKTVKVNNADYIPIDSGKVGDAFFYKLKIENQGSGVAQNVEIIDEYDPTQLQIINSSVPYTEESKGKIKWMIPEIPAKNIIEIEIGAILKQDVFEEGLTIVKNKLRSNSPYAGNDSFADVIVEAKGKLMLDKKISLGNGENVKELRINLKEKNNFSVRYALEIMNTGDGIIKEATLFDEINPLLKYGNVVWMEEGVAQKEKGLEIKVENLKPGEKRIFQYEVSFDASKLIQGQVTGLKNIAFINTPAVELESSSEIKFDFPITATTDPALLKDENESTSHQTGKKVLGLVQTGLSNIVSLVVGIGIILAGIVCVRSNRIR